MQPQPNIEKKETVMQTTSIESGYSPELLSSILAIDKASFDEQYDDAEHYYREALENPENINVTLHEGSEVVGYLLAVPHNKIYEELKEDDQEMEPNAERMYIETIAITPEHRNGRGSFKMILAMIEEAGKRGCNKFSMHTRVDNGLSRTVQKYFGDMITKVRRIENWKYYYNGEPTDYMEGTFEKK